MGIFRKRQDIDFDEQDRQYEQAKREGGWLLNGIVDRINDGTATREDKRIFNVTRTRAGRIK